MVSIVRVRVETIQSQHIIIAGEAEKVDDGYDANLIEDTYETVIEPYQTMSQQEVDTLE